MLETAAQRYRKLAKEKTELHPVTCECGMEWQCIRRDLNFWIESGVMPTELATAAARLQQSGKLTETEIVGSLTGEQLAMSIEFTSKVVRMTAAEPRIVEKPKEDENELGFDEVMQCCYGTIRDWQLRGGGKARSLDTFPQE